MGVAGGRGRSVKVGDVKHKDPPEVAGVSDSERERERRERRSSRVDQSQPRSERPRLGDLGDLETRHSSSSVERRASDIGGMCSAYVKTYTPGLKPGVSVLWCTGYTPRPFCARFTQETTNPYILLVRIFRFLAFHSVPTLTYYISTDTYRCLQSTNSVYNKLQPFTNTKNRTYCILAPCWLNLPRNRNIAGFSLVRIP